MFLYVPSYPLLKGVGFNNIASVALSPIISIAVYGTASIIFGFVGIFTNFYVLFCSYVLICIIVFLVLNKCRGLDFSALKDCSGWKWIFLYAAVGLLITAYIFLAPMGDPMGMGQNYDDMHHYSVIRNFLNSGNYSILHTSIYGDLNHKTTFYPAGMHLIVASVASAGNFSTVVTYNAFLFVSVAIIWSTGWLYYVSTVFKENKKVFVVASFLIFACYAFPWNFLIYGRISPNLLSFCLLPGCLGVFMNCFKTKTDKRSIKKGIIFVIIIGYVAIFTQPNLIFSMIVLMYAYCIELIIRSNYKVKLTGGRVLPCKTVACLFSLIVLIVWLLFYISPFTIETRRFNWPSRALFSDALINAITLTHANTITIQGILVGILASVGIVYIFKTKKNYWLVCSYLITFFIYVWCSLFEGRIKHFIGGFWYTDQYRLIGLLAIAAIPLIICGGLYIFECFQRVFKVDSNRTIVRAFGIYSLVFVLVFFVPSISYNGMILKSTAGNIQTRVRDLLSVSDNGNELFLNRKKMQFLDEVKKITGDSFVENSPLDGSLLAFQYNGIKTIHRHIFTGSDAGSVDMILDNEVILSQSLDTISTDSSLRKLAQKDNIKYVLKLADNDATYPEVPWTDTKYNYNISRYFKGVMSINDDTPGFKKILEDGEMRLYEIEY